MHLLLLDDIVDSCIWASHVIKEGLGWYFIQSNQVLDSRRQSDVIDGHESLAFSLGSLRPRHLPLLFFNDINLFLLLVNLLNRLYLFST